VIRHLWQGDANCQTAKHHFNDALPERLEEEAYNLACLPPARIPRTSAPRWSRRGGLQPTLA